MVKTSPALRADAELNRERIMAAARSVFAEQGLDAPMREVARAAGVGVGTLYRRFPTRADLITQVFMEKMTGYADAVDKALADPDPWRGFRWYVETVCAMQADDHGFTAVLTLSFPTAPEFEAERARAYRGFVELIRKAKAGGRLRADFVADDLVLLLMANAGVIAATGVEAPRTWRRLVAYMIQAFAATDAEKVPPPPSSRAMFRAMVRLSKHDESAAG